ncbi:Pkinase-domain-containing protein [Suhomyces tanzawaensis NRRL Y-17324]|uniref:non-specific serine/threonine protein kinase n=1 Tax=Suhomyces tanzawaensis NRRL Y-17324 TaxID=984487 RepID=A0A1E4SF76_9ASCO|nr:Pkinase-domain-containing protein [Suhomyces tanzawaensis NRRL Y-17324]ODV78052.1 Pkinase-domain-containing protein [Suhomyces tanzawaensis NRRL Y-17324]
MSTNRDLSLLSNHAGAREQGALLPAQAASLPRSSLLEKARLRDIALRKYQEAADGDGSSYTQDFAVGNSQELDLSFLRFSQASGSLIVRSSGSRGSESPFLRKVQDSYVEYSPSSRSVEASIRQAQGSKSPSKPLTSSQHQLKASAEGSMPKKSPFSNIYSISENSINDENESPFIEKSRPDNQIKVHKLRSTNELTKPTKSSTSNRTGFSAPRPITHSNATPDRNRHNRNPSVKVSLTPAQRFEKRPGTRLSNALENFQFSTLIGRGAYACVYKGINLKTSQIVAIKQIILEKDQDVMELMGEIDLLKILKHPNIVKYHGFVKTSTSLNVFLEFCSGGSLRQIYKKQGKGFPEHEVIDIVRLILLGLNYLHQQGVVHRDVKAANVLLTEEGDIKLADFGVATKVNSQHHTVVGTPNWMAPETILGGEGICTASDIWSLGATIIELFTTNPPYHDLNPMATLHAIGTDEHPPLPKNMTSVAKDFLLECFQKQPNLRISAKLLLKHKWLNLSTTKAKPSIMNLQQARDLKSINSYSESNEENWDNDFNGNEEIKILKKPEAPSVIQLEDLEDLEDSFKKTTTEAPPVKYSKSELLTKFSDQNEMEFDTNDIITLKMKSNGHNTDQDHEDEYDPFFDLDIENFDTNELEIQIKMEYLINKFSSRLNLCYKGGDELAKSLIKITGRMLHLVKKYQILHLTLIKDHGILSLLEVLEYTKEFSKHQKLWFHILSILNHLFELNQSIFENFCLLGGIPLITQFRSRSYDLAIRLQVIKFITHFKVSEKALTMLISCGGLRVLTKFVEEDFDSVPIFPLVSIECIHIILSKDLIRSKSDLCRILSKYGVVNWFAVLLNKLVKIGREGINEINPSTVQETINMLIEIIRYFGQSEPRVRANISSSDLFKSLIQVYEYLSFSHQLVIIKFLKSMSCLSNVLKSLYSADILSFLASQIKNCAPSTAHYKEFMNIVCPVLYNCCYLNHSKEIEIVNLGLVPHLKKLSMINLPFKQFVLPILCELVYCDDEVVRQSLKANEVLNIYFELLVDPYWQSNSLDSIMHWYQQDGMYMKANISKQIDWLIKGFLISKVSNLESTLENYLKLLTLHKEVVKYMLRPQIYHDILNKLEIYNKNPVIQLTLLRILKVLIVNDPDMKILSAMSIEDIKELMKLRSGSVLIDELVHEIMNELDERSI